VPSQNNFWNQKLRQLGDIRRDPSRLLRRLLFALGVMLSHLRPEICLPCRSSFNAMSQRHPNASDGDHNANETNDCRRTLCYVALHLTNMPPPRRAGFHSQ
jgi:hypothetical protein